MHGVQQALDDHLLVGDTSVVRDQDGSMVAYSPFSGMIARVSRPVWQDSEALSEYQSEGLFNEPPPSTPWRNAYTSLTLFLTRSCNMNCVYCYARANARPSRMTWRTAKAAIDTFAAQHDGDSLRLCFHGGGEQTTELGLMSRVVDYCRSLEWKTCTFILTTNGVLSQDAVRLLANNAFRVAVSLDGPPDIQDAQRPLASGRPSSSVVESAVRQLIEAGCHVAVRPTIVRFDEAEVLRAMEYFRSLGVRKVVLQPVSSTGRAAESAELAERSTDLKPFVSAFIAALDFAHETDMQVVNSSFDLLFGGKPAAYCGAAGGRTLVVTSDGLLTGCYEVVGEDSDGADVFLYGSLDPEEGCLVIDSEKRNRLTERMADLMEPCASCFAKFICAGACPVRSVSARGGLLRPDPFSCGFARAVIPEVIRRVALASGV